VSIQGLKSEQPRTEFMSPKQFVKLHQGNDIWALAVVQNTEHLAVTDTPTIITEVLQEFADVFDEPTAA
jgi:hypothetical protein